MSLKTLKTLTLSGGVALGLATTAAAERMTSDQIVEDLIGGTFEARRMGMTLLISYDEGGSVAVKSRLMNADGSWHLEGDQLCITFDSGPRRGTTCNYMTALGDGAYETSEGLVMRASR